MTPYNAGSPLLSSALTLEEAAVQLSEHHEILRAGDASDVLSNGLPLPADVMIAEHVVPR